MPLTLHGILAYALFGFLLIGTVIANVPPLRRRFGSAGRWLRLTAAALFCPLMTTGMLAHCERQWAAAAVESAPPNLPWYRLSRDAAAVTPAWQSPAIAWHVWLGATLTAILVMSWLARRRLQPWLTPRRADIAGPILGCLAFVVLVTGYTLARHDPRATHSSALPAIYMLFLGLTLFFAVVLIGLALHPHPKPRPIAKAAIAACIPLAAALATNLWLTTAWQPARLPALAQQPRDLAQLLTGLCALPATAAVAWTTRGRWRTGLATVLALLVALHLWFTALVLYDGSHRASPLWRFHRPFVQHPD